MASEFGVFLVFDCNRLLHVEVGLGLPGEFSPGGLYPVGFRRRSMFYHRL